MKIALLNTAIATVYGEYSYRPIDVENAKRLIETHGYESYIGHESTANILSRILEIDIPVHRGVYLQQGGMIALVFKLNGRLEGVKELTEQEIIEMGYTLGTLMRTS